MNSDIKILRELAWQYAQIMHDENNAERLKLHKAVNDLKQIRPVVLIDEIPWNEINVNGELTLKCKNESLKNLEQMMRRTIFQYKYFPGDMIVKPYIPVFKKIHASSWNIGVNIKERTLKVDKNNSVVSHEYEDQFEYDNDIFKLKNPIVTYDKEATQEEYNLIGEILGDIIPVKISGVDYFQATTWDDIAVYRGVTPLLIDLIDRPEFTHRLVKRLTDIRMDVLTQYEQLGLFESDPNSLHCTPIATDDLPMDNLEDTKLTRKNIWGRGAAQIFASVGKAVHEEFDIDYMKNTIGLCGLAYYGCCEPLDKKIDIIEKIPNLRKISISPWADVDIAADAIQHKYVLSAKPNPAAVAVSKLDIADLRKEIKKILDACARNGCSCDIVLKDISTCQNRPENIFEWEHEVMAMVKSY